jgi:FeoB-associated Cys-rich membrane protein
MEWQVYLVLPIVAAAAAYLGLQAWRSWGSGKGGCGGSCGCAKKSPAPAAGADGVTIIPVEQLTLRRKDLGRS